MNKSNDYCLPYIWDGGRLQKKSSFNLMFIFANRRYVRTANFTSKYFIFAKEGEEEA